MTKTEYLFGVKPCYFKNREFYEVAKVRVELAKKLKHNLIWDKDNPYVAGKDAKLDERIAKITKAIEFWEAILEELRGC